MKSAIAYVLAWVAVVAASFAIWGVLWSVVTQAWWMLPILAGAGLFSYGSASYKYTDGDR